MLAGLAPPSPLYTAAMIGCMRLLPAHATPSVSNPRRYCWWQQPITRKPGWRSRGGLAQWSSTEAARGNSLPLGAPSPSRAVFKRLEPRSAAAALRFTGAPSWHSSHVIVGKREHRSSGSKAPYGRNAENWCGEGAHPRQPRRSFLTKSTPCRGATGLPQFIRA